MRPSLGMTTRNSMTNWMIPVLDPPRMSPPGRMRCRNCHEVAATRLDRETLLVAASAAGGVEVEVARATPARTT